MKLAHPILSLPSQLNFTCLTVLLCILVSACQPEVSIKPINDGEKVTINWQVDEVLDAEFSATKIHDFSRVMHTFEHGANQEKSSIQPSQTYSFVLQKKRDELDQVQLLQGSTRLLTEALYQSSLVGLCFNQHNLSPAIFINSVDAGIGIDYPQLWALDPQQQWRSMVLPDSASFMVDNVICADNQYSDWTAYLQHPNSQPCRCDFQDDIFSLTELERWQALLPEQVNIAEPFADEVGQESKLKHVMPVSLYLIEDQQAVNSMIEHALLDPVYESRVITHAAIRFVNLLSRQGLYQNVGYSFVQKEGIWYVWTIAGESSKGFHPITDIQQQTDSLIHMQMCVADCSWWGKQALVEVDLQQLSVKLLEYL